MTNSQVLARIVRRGVAQEPTWSLAPRRRRIRSVLYSVVRRHVLTPLIEIRDDYFNFDQPTALKTWKWLSEFVTLNVGVGIM